MAKVTKAMLEEQNKSLTLTAKALEKRCAEVVALSEQVKREMKDALAPAVIRLESHLDNAAMFVGAVSEELDGIKKALGMPNDQPLISQQEFKELSEALHV